MKNKFSLFILIILILLIVFLGCFYSGDVSKMRSRYAKNKKKNIKIGVVWPFELYKDLAWQGVELAVDEINSTGGILNKKIELIKKDDDADVTKGLEIAEDFSENSEVMAVIGHSDSYVSINVALTYEISKLIMFSPSSTATDLTSKGYKYIFRNVPTDDFIGAKAAYVCNEKNNNRIMISYAENSYGMGLANSFEKNALSLSLRIIERSSFELGSIKEFEYILSKWKIYNYDAIFFAGTIEPAIKFITKVRENNLDIPIFGGDGMDSIELLKLNKDITQNIYMVTFFNPNTKRKENVDFKQKFKMKYDLEPDTSAAQSYDAINILVKAMKEVNSCDPIKVADQIRNIKNWNGVTGNHTFNEKGDVSEKTVVLKYIENGEFKFEDID